MDFEALHAHVAEANRMLEIVALSLQPGREIGDVCIAVSQLSAVVAALLDEREQAAADDLTEKGGTAGELA